MKNFEICILALAKSRSNNIHLFYNSIKDQHQNLWFTIPDTRDWGDSEEPAKETGQEEPEKKRKPSYSCMRLSDKLY